MNRYTPISAMRCLFYRLFANVVRIFLGTFISIQAIQCFGAGQTAIKLDPINSTVCEGDAVTFASSASGSDRMEYRWQTLSANRGEWTDLADVPGISGAKTTHLNLERVPYEFDGESYRLVIRAKGISPVYGRPARLLVIHSRDSKSEGIRRVIFTETAEAFQNPMKGFRPTRYIGDSKLKPQEYASVFKHYISYTDLESSTSDTVKKIVDWSNRAWSGIEGENIKVIPRVVIYYPDNDEFWADGIPHSEPAYKESNWTNIVLEKRLVAMIGKLGAAWDDDPRVAAVELGLWGKWGEHHIDPARVTVIPADATDSSRVPPEFQKAMGDAAVRAFKTKKVMIRYSGDTFKAYDFGCYWDSFALPEDAVSGNAEISKDNWRAQMNSGEVAFDWGTKAAVGGSPNGALLDTPVADRISSWIRRTHTSSLGWISDYDPKVAAIQLNAQEMQKTMGYRFVVKEACYSEEVRLGSKLFVEFTVTNVGSAPFYYSWPVQAVLLREDKSVAWRGTFVSDIRRWLNCQDYTVSEQFDISGALPKGTYVLALCICDPAGMLPSIRFANTNYLRGGWMPVGKVGISEKVDHPALDSFDSLSADHTLRYIVDTSRLTGMD